MEFKENKAWGMFDVIAEAQTLEEKIHAVRMYIAQRKVQEGKKNSTLPERPL